MHRPDAPPPEPPDARPRPRPRLRARKVALALTVLGLLASLLALAPASPAQAVTRPTLIVGGFMQTTDLSEDVWVPKLAQLGVPSSQVRVLELSGVIPGLDSMEESANEIHLAISDMYEDFGDQKIDIIAVSQGAPAARRTLVKFPASQDMVAGFVSVSGINAGIPDESSYALFDEMLTRCATGWVDFDVCEQIVYLDVPGNTTWLRALNGIQPPGDPTPGPIDYFHIYSARTTDDPPLDEGIPPYGWTQPLPGTDETKSAQAACSATNPNRFAPHAAMYLTDGPDPGTDWDPDAVMFELMVDALNRRSLTIDNPATTCADHPGYPSP